MVDLAVKDSIGTDVTSGRSETSIPLPESTQQENQAPADPTPTENPTPVEQSGTKDKKPEDKGSTLMTGGEPEKKEPESKDEEYTLSLEDGSPLSEDHLKEVSELSKSLGLSKDQATKLLSHQSEQYKKTLDSQEKDKIEQSARWVDEIKKDTEMGGPLFKESVENAHRAFSRFGSKELKSYLDDSGLGNNPEMIRIFSRIGKAMADDKFVNGDPVSNKEPKSLGELMYAGFDY